MNRTISIFSAMLVLAISAIGGTYSGGSGTLSDPYQIGNTADLLQLAGNPSDYDRYFIQTDDIDLWGNSFDQAVIAPDTDSSENEFSGTPFTGGYDGDGYSIRNLTISAIGAASYIGMFGLNSGTIQNVHLDMLEITSENGDRVGGLCGSTTDIAEIRDCSVSGAITGGDYGTGGICGNNHGMIQNCAVDIELTTGNGNSGGVCGYNYGNISYCSSVGVISSGGESIKAGGLCGKNDVNGIIQQCLSECDVTGIASVGGFCGVNSGKLSDNYARGNSTASGNNCGGFCGYNDGEIIRSYSTGLVSGADYTGGLCGTNKNGQVSDSFWDVDTSGLSDGGNAGTGKTTVQMQNQTTFTSAGWNFSWIWQMDGYPALVNAAVMPERQIDFLYLEGSERVDEEASVTFSCTAYYPDESSENVTETALWSVNPPNYCSVSNGIVTAESVLADTTVYVIAEYQGLLSSNALTIVNVPAQTPPYSESFEDGFGIWKNMDAGDVTWTLAEGSTPSLLSGPEGASDGTGYIYVEASDNSPSYRAGIEVEFDFSYSGEPTLTFDYHMYGASMGSLSLDLYYGDTWHTDFWSIEGQQQTESTDAWETATVDLSILEGLSSVIIRFRAVTGDDYKSDIAIDNIELSNARSYSGGAGSSADPYIISNRTDLLALSFNESDYDKHFKQVADIDLQGDTFSASVIASDADEIAFTGSYDGGGFDIRNLTFETAGSVFSSLGFFGYISGAKLSNIALHGVAISAVNNADNIGSLCGVSMASVITNCTATEVSITCTNSSSVGGLIGALGNEDYDPFYDDNSDQGNLVQGCYFSGEIYASSGYELGGVIGYCGGVVSNTYADVKIFCEDYCSSVGGIVGQIDSLGACAECSVTGTLQSAVAVDLESAGGLCGLNAGKISYCNANVAITNDCQNSSHIGGLCGSNGDGFFFSEEVGKIYACFAVGPILIEGNISSIGGLVGGNYGDIKLSYAQSGIECRGNMDFGGGLCGANEGTVASSFSVGSVDCYGAVFSMGGFCGLNMDTITNCYSAGSITYGAGSSNVGGFCGDNSDVVIAGSFWDIQRSGLIYSDGATGLNTVQMWDYNIYQSAGWDFVNETVNGTEDNWVMDEYPIIYELPFDFDFPPVVVPDVVLLTVEGTNAVSESESIQFDLTAYYADQSVVDVTDKAIWSVVPQDYASIDDGLLSAAIVPSNLTVVVTGVFRGGAVTQEVNILDVSVPDYSESFEEGFGFWDQPYTNDFDWVIATGSTTSPLTGPSMASDGSNYLLADADNSPGQTAVIQSEFNLADAVNPVLSFDYHMYGQSMGALYVDVKVDGVEFDVVWMRNGQQQQSDKASWGNAVVDLSSYAEQPQVVIRFRAITGEDFFGDIALDNITLTDDVPPPEIDFEFLVIDGANEVFEEGVLLLKGYAFYADESFEEVTSQATWSLDQSGSAAITNGMLYAGLVDADFSVSVTMNYLGHSAKKDVTIINIPPPSPPVTNSFEKSMEIWENSESFDFAWSRNSGATPTPFTGPSGASDGNYYLYAEASENIPDKDASVEAVFDLSSVVNPALEFDYHMYGSYIGSLTVDVFDGAIWHTGVWQRDGAQHFSSDASWTTALVSLQAYIGQVVTLRFVAHIGSTQLGDIAIDNIRVYDRGTVAYSKWVVSEAIPSGEQADDACPAGDGIPNLLKYACGLPAMTPATTADYLNIAIENNSNEFSILYYKSKATQDVSLIPVWSNSLPGGWSAAGLSIFKISETTGREVWQATLVGEEKGFFTLQAVRD